MIEVKNQFARHGLFWVWILPIILLVSLPALLPTERMTIKTGEVAFLQKLGVDTDKVASTANDVFRQWFVATGAVQATRRFVTPRQQHVTNETPDGVRDSASITQRFVQNFWLMVYRVIWRLIGLWPLFSVLMLAFVLPAVVDGATSRAKMADTFGQSNPVFFWGAGHSAVGVLGIFFLLPLLPIPIGMLMLYGTVAVVSFSLWVLAANFQTGV